MAEFDIPASFLDFYAKQGMGNVDEQETAYVPITGADLGLPMGPGVPAPAGVEMGDPFQIVQSGGTPDWITNAQNPSPVNLPPYSNPMLSGQAYAGLISGGQAVPSMIAPGVSYSMNSPMGYTAPGASAVPFLVINHQKVLLIILM